ncbi:hypothetical protein H310_11683 [Aphanomyces invadans]|uniref:U-box domain-containing protein n=1 Tax=Aphanomyces invadans TaxID=157072 RepID=A0A024TKN3_9STRA|nr:hypothetical protein H310_11683 [Aphanomyces invadans]ETV94710.1 hypothetical protein H310_11683 [Aphanomyces invadans]|eukprot:XP_008876655.1 hypothetical protein H310_11683 [Aphanomyces invadans]
MTLVPNLALKQAIDEFASYDCLHGCFLLVSTGLHTAFLCPLTHALMTDPVVLACDGHSYERASLMASRRHLNHYILVDSMAEDDAMVAHTTRRPENAACVYVGEVLSSNATFVTHNIEVLEVDDRVVSLPTAEFGPYNLSSPDRAPVEPNCRPTNARVLSMFPPTTSIECIVDRDGDVSASHLLLVAIQVDANVVICRDWTKPYRPHFIASNTPDWARRLDLCASNALANTLRSTLDNVLLPTTVDSNDDGFLVEADSLVTTNLSAPLKVCSYKPGACLRR